MGVMTILGCGGKDEKFARFRDVEQRGHPFLLKQIHTANETVLTFLKGLTPAA
jgi:hypothetical protein